LNVGGGSLIQRTIDVALSSSYVDRLILSSDDPAIIAAAKAGGCEVPFVRDAALSGDEALVNDVVVDALRRVPGYDIVLLLQPTSPLRTAGDIDGVLERLEATGARACVTLRPAEEHPYWSFKLGEGAHLVRFAQPSPGQTLRRQDLPEAWYLNGAIYAARVDWFLSVRSFLSDETVGYPMPIERSLDIDTAADAEKLRQMV